MSNPVFSSSPIFGKGRPTRGTGAGSTLDAASVAQPGMDAAALDQMYRSPSATSWETDRMTYDDVIVRTGSLLVILVGVGAVTWAVAPQLYLVGMIVGFGLGLVNAFKKQPSPALIMAYAVAEGVFLGGISQFFEVRWPGIVIQAVLATVATFAVALALFRSGKVRVTPKFTRWLMISMGGYVVFSLVNLVLVWSGTMDGFGLRSSVITIGGFSIPLGVLVGIVAVGMAAASLIVDFDSIQRGVNKGIAKRYAWAAAFGLLVTLVWLYIEFLRILALLRGR
jgi:uncharacterized YccA/Bax inhibitor family protein